MGTLQHTSGRQRGSCAGVYESDPKFWAIDGIPQDFTEELLAPDFDRLEPHLLRVMQRLPAFGSAGIKVINNGPICYTPDGLPLLGPVESRPGLWLAAGFAIGIGTGGGSGGVPGALDGRWRTGDRPCGRPPLAI